MHELLMATLVTDRLREAEQARGTHPATRGRRAMPHRGRTRLAHRWLGQPSSLPDA
jgi:hypothetical protein